ncbi:MAG: membrane protein insertase YidC [Rikenellaceae bacterium]
MDKKTITGMVLMALILIGFTFYSTSQQKKFAEQQRIADSIYRAQKPIVVKQENSVLGEKVEDTIDADIKAKAELEQHLGGVLYAASEGEEKFYTLENDVIKLEISNKGARVASAELKEYKTYKGTPLMLFQKEASKFNIEFFVKQGYNNIRLNTADYYFTSDASEVTTAKEGAEAQSVSMKLFVAEGAYVEYVYTISEGDYMVNFDMNFVGMSDMLANQSDMTLTWKNTGARNEKGFDNENKYTTIAYMFPGESSMEQLGISDSSKAETVNSKMEWVAFKQQFFSSIFISGKDKMLNGELSYNTYTPSSDLIKDFSAVISLPFNASQDSYNYQFYFGPNRYYTLNQYDLGIQKLVPLGWGIFGWVNRWLVIPIFEFLSRFISSYGIIILLLTIIIKIIISPLTYKSYLSTAKMRLLKPEMKAIADKYPNQSDAMKKQQATMELYKKAGVSPMGGCWPMLIQFPILIAMFNFFPSSIELRGEHFLWADDLSSYDSILNLPFDIPFYGNHVSLFALLMAASIYITSKINYNQTADSAPQMAGMKFMMLYMMPVMMLLWFNNYSSGLSYYYLVSNIITIGQTLAFRYAVDDNKLHQRMKANAKKPAKKSKWQARYEEMARQQQLQQRNKK